MNEPFILSVRYKDAEHEFKARFERLGYTHQIAVLIGDTVVTFEPDEEGSYRALSATTMDAGLLTSVVQKLATL